MRKLNTKVLKSSDKKRVGVKETLEVENKSRGPKPPKPPITPTPRPRYVTWIEFQQFKNENNKNINAMEQRMNSGFAELKKLILNQNKK